MKKLFLLLCGLIFVAACSDDSVAGRGIWDETENGLAIIVTGESGERVAGAKVRLVRATASVEDSAVTNSDGLAKFVRPSFAGFAEVASDEGVARSAFASGDSSVLSQLEAPARISGQISSRDGAYPPELYLYGTSYRAAVDPEGNFSFDSLPKGDYAILSASDSAFEFWTGLGLNASAESVELREPSKDSVLIDDFEDGRGTNLFYPLTGGGWWFSKADSTGSVSPSPLEKGFVKSEESWNGTQSFHQKFTLDPTVTGAYAFCGFDIGVSQLIDSLISYDMSGVDSVTFFVRGSGHLVMQFGGYDSTGVSATWTFEFDIPSESEWNRVSVVPGENPDWLLISPRMKTINFFMWNSTDLWLDEFVFHGISASELFRRELSR